MAKKAGWAEVIKNAGKWVAVSPIAPFAHIYRSVTQLSISPDTKRGSLLAEQWTRFREKLHLDHAPADPRCESFEAAVARLKLTPAGIKLKERQIRIVSRSYYACALALLAYSPLQVNDLFALFCVQVLVLLCAAKGWSAAFRAWQVRERRLGPFREFAHKPEAWLA